MLGLNSSRSFMTIFTMVK
jgi:hypothetical protein